MSRTLYATNTNMIVLLSDGKRKNKQELLCVTTVFYKNTQASIYPVANVGFRREKVLSLIGIIIFR